MRVFSVHILTVAALSLGLGACVPEDALVQAGMSAPPPVAPQTDPTIYVATSDNGFTVPAVPVEKVPPEFQRQEVTYPTNEAVGTVIINPGAKHLYLITGKNRATQYGIAVGRAGFEWAGEAMITSRTTWPKWTPPPEMIVRRPELEKWKNGQPGGPTNPLGARALYLTTNGIDYGYRIHGTPEWESIGHNASSGCIRMINQDVMDLYNRVADGAKVVVLNADGSYPTALKLPPKAPAPKKAAAPAAAPIIVPMPAVMPVPVVTGPGIATAPALAPIATVPAVLPEPAAPAATPDVVPCAEPLVNGVCPAPKTTP
jgi:lipoprotein-anchoring transpeptidase ErfK/SrfK